MSGWYIWPVNQLRRQLELARKFAVNNRAVTPIISLPFKWFERSFVTLLCLFLPDVSLLLLPNISYSVPAKLLLFGLCLVVTPMRTIITLSMEWGSWRNVSCSRKFYIFNCACLDAPKYLNLHLKLRFPAICSMQKCTIFCPSGSVIVALQVTLKQVNFYHIILI